MITMIPDSERGKTVWVLLEVAEGEWCTRGVFESIESAALYIEEMKNIHGICGLWRIEEFIIQSKEKHP